MTANPPSPEQPPERSSVGQPRTGQPSADETATINDMIDRAQRHDAASPISEQGCIQLRSEREGVRHLLLRQFTDGPLVGYAQLTEDAEGVTAELLVDPDARGLGLGRALLAAVQEQAGGPVRVWAHGGLPAARALAERAGLRTVRELRQMRRPLTAADAAPSTVPLPAGVRVRTFVPGRDEQAWLELNARAFSDHPEQGDLGPRDLRERMAEDWFDPAGFFLAARTLPDGTERLVGFHWTKTHADENLGEVYVVGVDPDEQGGGLGRALTDIGVRHLAERGYPGVLLYVEADNPAAVRVYERLGFTIHEVDLMYQG